MGCGYYVDDHVIKWLESSNLSNRLHVPILNVYHYVSTIIEVVAQTDVSVLVVRNPLFDDHLDCNLYVSIQQFSRLLENIFEDQQRTVSTVFLYQTIIKIFILIFNRQEDLGLVVYDNDAFILFKELLTPTFFLIITIIQVHFVHKDFLEFSNIDGILERFQNPSNDSSPTHNESLIERQETLDYGTNASSSKASLDQSDNVRLDMELSQSELSSIQTVITKNAPLRQQPPPPSSPRFEVQAQEASFSGSIPRDETVKSSTMKRSFWAEMNEIFKRCKRYIETLLSSLMVVFWRIMEIHIVKFVLLCAIIISMKDVSYVDCLLLQFY